MNLRSIIGNITICIVLFLCGINFGLAQETTTSATITTLDTLSYEQTAKNTVYGEIGGNGRLYSLNYDRLITKNISLRAGFAYMPGMFLGHPFLQGNVASFTMIAPLSASYLFAIPESSSFIETGFGVSMFILYNSVEFTHATLGLVSFSQTDVVPALVPMLGCRLQPQIGGFNFRFVWTPLTVLWGEVLGRPIDRFIAISSFALSFGYTF